MDLWPFGGAVLVLVLLWKAARWTGKVDTELRTLKGFMEEIRGDLNRIFVKIGPPPATDDSPLHLAEPGERVAERHQVAVRREESNQVPSPRYTDWDDYLRNAPRGAEDLHEAVAEMRSDRTPATEREPRV